MELFKPNRNYKIMHQAKYFIAISTILVIASLCSIVFKGFKYGIDFTGGTEVQVKFGENINVKVGDIRDALSNVKLGQSEVQAFGDPKDKEFLIRIDNAYFDLTKTKDLITKKLAADFKNFSSFSFKSTEDGYANFSSEVSADDIKKSILALTVSDVTLETVESFGTIAGVEKQYKLKFKGISDEIGKILEEKFGKGTALVQRVETVGPKVGAELRNKSFYAIILMCLMILLYIALRFDFRSAPGAVLSLSHDALLIIGVFSFFGLEFNLTIVAVVLTTIGYSINDTIVIYDRIRENLKRYKRESLFDIMNISINQTMSRTIITNFTVFLVVLALLLFGGRMIRDFAIAFTVGIVAGTYSTVYIANPTTLFIDNLSKKKKTA